MCPASEVSRPYRTVQCKTLWIQERRYTNAPRDLIQPILIPTPAVKVVYLRSLVTNWVGYAANVVVAFFLSPFIVHTLGDSGYGVWSLLMSIVGYVGLIDLGVRVS